MKKYKFKDLDFKKDNYKKQAILFFDNWFWISIIQWKYTHWWKNWLYKIAVLKWKEDKANLCYDTEITNDRENTKQMCLWLADVVRQTGWELLAERQKRVDNITEEEVKERIIKNYNTYLLKYNTDYKTVDKYGTCNEYIKQIIFESWY